MPLTETPFPLFLLSFLFAPAAATAEPLQHDVDVREDDERRGQDGPVVEGHDQLVPLELPHLVGDGLHLKEGVAVGVNRGTHLKIYSGTVCSKSGLK